MIHDKALIFFKNTVSKISLIVSFDKLIGYRTIEDLIEGIDYKKEVIKLIAPVLGDFGRIIDEEVIEMTFFDYGKNLIRNEAYNSELTIVSTVFELKHDHVIPYINLQLIEIDEYLSILKNCEFKNDVTEELLKYLLDLRSRVKKLLAAFQNELTDNTIIEKDDQEIALDSVNINTDKTSDLRLQFKRNNEFNKVLSLTSCALLLHYLQDKSVTPNYPKYQMGTLGSILFDYSPQNLRTKYSEVSASPKNHKTDLQKLKILLQVILDEIESDLK